MSYYFIKQHVLQFHKAVCRTISRLDYGNSILFGLPVNQLNCLKEHQSAAACFVTSTKSQDHISSHFSPSTPPPSPIFFAKHNELVVYMESCYAIEIDIDTDTENTFINSASGNSENNWPFQPYSCVVLLTVVVVLLLY